MEHDNLGFGLKKSELNKYLDQYKLELQEQVNNIAEQRKVSPTQNGSNISSYALEESLKNINDVFTDDITAHVTKILQTQTEQAKHLDIEIENAISEHQDVDVNNVSSTHNVQEVKKTVGHMFKQIYDDDILTFNETTNKFEVKGSDEVIYPFQTYINQNERSIINLIKYHSQKQAKYLHSLSYTGSRSNEVLTDELQKDYEYIFFNLKNINQQLVGQAPIYHSDYINLSRLQLTLNNNTLFLNLLADICMNGYSKSQMVDIGKRIKLSGLLNPPDILDLRDDLHIQANTLRTTYQETSYPFSTSVTSVLQLEIGDNKQFSKHPQGFPVHEKTTVILLRKLLLECTIQDRLTKIPQSLIAALLTVQTTTFYDTHQAYYPNELLQECDKKIKIGYDTVAGQAALYVLWHYQEFPFKYYQNRVSAACKNTSTLLPTFFYYCLSMINLELTNNLSRADAMIGFQLLLDSSKHSFSDEYLKFKSVFRMWGYIVATDIKYIDTRHWTRISEDLSLPGDCKTYLIKGDTRPKTLIDDALAKFSLYESYFQRHLNVHLTHFRHLTSSRETSELATHYMLFLKMLERSIYASNIYHKTLPILCIEKSGEPKNTVTNPIASVKEYIKFGDAYLPYRPKWDPSTVMNGYFEWVMNRTLDTGIYDDDIDFMREFIMAMTSRSQGKVEGAPKSMKIRLINALMNLSHYCSLEMLHDYLSVGAHAGSRYQIERRMRLIVLVTNAQQIGQVPLLVLSNYFKDIDHSIAVGKNNGAFDYCIQLTQSGDPSYINYYADVSAMDASLTPQLIQGIMLTHANALNKCKNKKDYFCFKDGEHVVYDEKQNYLRTDKVSGVTLGLCYMSRFVIGESIKLSMPGIGESNVNSLSYRSGEYNTSGNHSNLLVYAYAEMLKRFNSNNNSTITMEMQAMGDDIRAQFGNFDNDLHHEVLFKYFEDELMKINLRLETDHSRIYTDFLKMSACCGSITPEPQRVTQYMSEDSQSTKRAVPMKVTESCDTTKTVMSRVYDGECLRASYYWLFFTYSCYELKVNKDLRADGIMDKLSAHGYGYSLSNKRTGFLPIIIMNQTHPEKGFNLYVTRFPLSYASAPPRYEFPLRYAFDNGVILPRASSLCSNGDLLWFDITMAHITDDRFAVEWSRQIFSSVPSQLQSTLNQFELLYSSYLNDYNPNVAISKATIDEEISVNQAYLTRRLNSTYNSNVLLRASAAASELKMRNYRIPDPNVDIRKQGELRVKSVAQSKSIDLDIVFELETAYVLWVSKYNERKHFQQVSGFFKIITPNVIWPDALIAKIDITARMRGKVFQKGVHLSPAFHANSIYKLPLLYRHVSAVDLIQADYNVLRAINPHAKQINTIEKKLLNSEIAFTLHGVDALPLTYTVMGCSAKERKLIDAIVKKDTFASYITPYKTYQSGQFSRLMGQPYSTVNTIITVLPPHGFPRKASKYYLDYQKFMIIIFTSWFCAHPQYFLTVPNFAIKPSKERIKFYSEYVLKHLLQS